MIWAIKRSKGPIPLLASQRPNSLARCTSQGRQVSPSALARVLVFHLHGQPGLGREGFMQAVAGLDAGLFVGREHKFILVQWLSLPLVLVEIQDPTRFERELRIPRKNPTAMLPRTNGIFMKPAPERRVTQLGDQATLANLPIQFVQTPAGEWGVMRGRQFAGQGFNLDDEFWGKRSGGDPVEGVLPSRPTAARRSACAIG